MKIDWTPEILDALNREKLRGQSLKDLQSTIFVTYGVDITIARISQVLKAYRAKLQEELPF
ncbi:MAG: hypothetical protein NUV80_07380 [Candidatus Berkelbacteria bacterium]|nr:hypothetical protein [Candidatus Berkelbacteria bacterium]